MNNLEKEYHKRFHNQQLPNEDFDAEGLWDEIAQELPPETPRPAGKYWRALAILLLVGVGLSFYFGKINRTQLTFQQSNENVVSLDKLNILQNNEKAENATRFNEIEKATSGAVTKNKENSIEIKNEKKTSKVKDNIVAATQKEKINTAENYINVKQESVVLNKKVAQPKEKKTSVAQNKTSLKEEPIANNKQVTVVDKEFIATGNNKTANQNEAPGTKYTTAITQKRDGSIKQTESVDHKQAESNHNPEIRTRTQGNNNTKLITPHPVSITQNENEVFGKKHYKVLKKLPLKIVNTLKTQVTELNISKAANNLLPAKKSNRLQFQLGLLGGYSFTNFKFTSNTVELGNQNTLEKPNWGTQFGIEASILWNKQWILKTGIEENRLWTKFDYEKKDTIPVLKENVIIQVTINDGDTISKVTGNVTVNSYHTHKIIHHNRYHQISLPIELGIQKEIGKISLGCTAGIAFNKLTKIEGRTLYPNGEITFFNNHTENLPLQQTYTLSWRLSPFITFQLNDKYAIKLQTQWIGQNHAGFSNVKTKVNQYNAVAGIAYRF